MNKAVAKLPGKTKTTAYDVSEHLRTPEEMQPIWMRGLKRRQMTLLELPVRLATSHELKACLRLPKTQD